MKVCDYHEVAGEEAAPGVTLRTVISAKDGAPTFTMRVFEVLPGSSTPHHAHWWEHEVFILSGQGYVQGAEGQRAIQTGCVVFLAGDEEHQFVNTGNEPLHFICCIPALEPAPAVTSGVSASQATTPAARC